MIIEIFFLQPHSQINIYFYICQSNRQYILYKSREWIFNKISPRPSLLYTPVHLLKFLNSEKDFELGGWQWTHASNGKQGKYPRSFWVSAHDNTRKYVMKVRERFFFIAELVRQTTACWLFRYVRLFLLYVLYVIVAWVAVICNLELNKGKVSFKIYFS